MGAEQIQTPEAEDADPGAQHSAAQWSDATQVILSVAMTAFLYLATFMVIDVMLRSEYAQSLRGGQGHRRATVTIPIRPIGQELHP